MSASAAVLSGSEAEKARVVARAVRCQLGATEILRGIDLEIAPGEVVGVVGPKGAGKTALFRIMAGLLAPTSGHVEIAGVARRAAEVAPRQARYLGSNEGVYRHATVREHLEFFAAAERVDDEGAVTRAIRAVDLETLEDRVASTLARAMRQRLHLARLLLVEPSVLLLDDPGRDLHPHDRKDLADLIAGLARSGMAVAVSGRRLAAVTDLAMTIVVMDKGVIAAEGPKDEIVRRVRSVARSRSPARPSRLLAIRMTRDAERAAALARAQPGVSSAWAVARDVLYLDLEGGDTETATLVRRLVLSGIDIVGVEPRAGELEHLFAKIGEGSA